MSLQVFSAEALGTMLLMLLGCGVVANAALAGAKGALPFRASCREGGR